MNSPRFPAAISLLLLCSIAMPAQTNGTRQQPAPDTSKDPKLLQRPSRSETADRAAEKPASPQQIQLVVPAGTPIRIALSNRVRIAHEGEPVHGKVTDTVYAFELK